MHSDIDKDAIASNPLMQRAQHVLGDRLLKMTMALDQCTLVVASETLLETLTLLRSTEGLQFEQCMDLCGVDYSQYTPLEEEKWTGPRFAVVYHLLSLMHNQRIRVRVFCQDDALPMIDSAVGIWPSVNWYEREAFDLFGIAFIGHPDLRRILTDYGFVGHPFRKDFPISGHVEMRYDAEQRRVIYQPVTIEPREIVPRIIREEGYGG